MTIIAAPVVIPAPIIAAPVVTPTRIVVSAVVITVTSIPVVVVPIVFVLPDYSNVAVSVVITTCRKHGQAGQSANE